MAAKSFEQWVRPKIAGMARAYNSINQSIKPSTNLASSPCLREVGKGFWRILFGMAAEREPASLLLIDDSIDIDCVKSIAIFIDVCVGVGEMPNAFALAG